LTKLFNKNSSKVTYVTKSSRYLNSGSYIAILSPEYYWIKKQKLPVKSLSKAKRLAPSLFEGSLPDGDYSYEVRKSGDEFVVIAYNPVEISQKLKEVFPTKSKVTNIYFAQDALSNINECVSIDERSALTNLNGILIQVPRQCSNTSSTIAKYLDTANLKTRGVRLNSSGKQLFEKRDIVILSILFAVILLSNLLGYISYKRDIKNLDQKRTDIIKEYNLPPTMIQIKSIKRSLDKKFKQQKLLRQKLFELSKIDLKKGEYISKLDFDGKNIELNIHIADKSRIQAIKNSISPNLKIASDNLEDDKLHIRIAI